VSKPGKPIEHGGRPSEPDPTDNLSDFPYGSASSYRDLPAPGATAHPPKNSDSEEQTPAVDGSLDERHCEGCPQGTTRDHIVQVRQHLSTEKESCREVEQQFQALVCVHYFIYYQRKAKETRAILPTTALCQCPPTKLDRLYIDLEYQLNVTHQQKRIYGDAMTRARERLDASEQKHVVLLCQRCRDVPANEVQKPKPRGKRNLVTGLVIDTEEPLKAARKGLAEKSPPEEVARI
jgi:hypothetical protein